MPRPQREHLALIVALVALVLGFFAEPLGLDWYVIAAVLVAVIVLEWSLFRREKAEEDSE